MPRARAACGTYAAYERHLREKSPVDDACRAAQRSRDAARSKSASAHASRAADNPAKASETPDTPVLPVPTTEDGHVSRLDVLKEQLQQSRETIARLKTSDPARVYLLMREQRETVREISEIQGNGQVKGVTLADQLAEARARRAAGA